MAISLKRNAAGYLAFILLSVAAHAQWTLPNPVLDSHKSQHGVLLNMKSGTLRLEVCSAAIFHLAYSPTASFPDKPNPVIIKTAWPETKWTLQETADAILLATQELRASVDRKTGSITYSDAAAHVLLHDDSKTMDPVTVNGEQTYRAEDYMTLGGYGSSEALYGLGQHQAGVWNYRGESVDLSQDNTSIAVPLMVSSNGLRALLEQLRRAAASTIASSMHCTSAQRSPTPSTITSLYGPELDKVIAGYRELTGSAPMFGKWAYGFWQCKNRYKSQAELLGVAHKYRKLKIPIDNIVQDWFWWNRKGEHVFNQNYPDPNGHDRGAAPGELSPDDLGVAILRAGINRLRHHGQEWLVHR